MAPDPERRPHRAVLYLIGDDGVTRPVGIDESDVEAALDELPRMTN